MDTYRVIGSCRVGGVEPGGVVELDGERTNIPALVEGGHVELVTPPARPAKGEGGDKGGSR